MEKLKLRRQQAKLRAYLDQHDFLKRDYVRERYNSLHHKSFTKTIDKHSKKEYSDILRNLGDRAPKSYQEFKRLSSEDRYLLKHDNRVVSYFKGEIKENLTDKQKQQAVEAYFAFRDVGILFGDHGIARYIERMRRKNGTFIYNYQTVVSAFSLPANYISDSNGRDARH